MVAQRASTSPINCAGDGIRQELEEEVGMDAQTTERNPNREGQGDECKRKRAGACAPALRGVVRAFRLAWQGGPEGPHYFIKPAACAGPAGRPASSSDRQAPGFAASAVLSGRVARTAW